MKSHRTKFQGPVRTIASISCGSSVGNMKEKKHRSVKKGLTTCSCEIELLKLWSRPADIVQL